MYGSNYIPDETKMKENQLRFRYWHVESLLNQAANLADQCLKDLDECMQLEIIEFTSNHEAEIQHVEIGDARNRTDIFERQLIETQNEIESHRLSNQHFYTAKFAASDLFDLQGDDAAKYAHIQSIQNKEQFAVAEIEREQKKLMLQKKLEWFTEDAEKDKSLWQYKEDHIELLRDQLEKDDGKMNYRIQKKFSYGRLSRNFADCLDRALTAEGGLFMIFGCDAGLQSLLRAEPELYLNRVNVLYNWIYESIEFLTAYSQLDQAFSVCVSLKGLLAKDTFDSLKNAGVYWSTTFKIPRDIFPTSTHSNIRFKGAGAFLLGKAGAIPWKINLQLPVTAVYTRNNNDVQIDQDQLPSLILGRVENKNSNRNMEYGGMVSLNNASPISADYEDPKTFWKIDIYKPLSEEELFSNIEDIVLEFSLTGKLFYEQA